MHNRVYESHVSNKRNGEWIKIFIDDFILLRKPLINTVS